MKTFFRLAVFALAAVGVLAFASSALATQRLAVSQPGGSVKIKISQDQSDSQPARITIYVPSGYALTATQAPGTKIGTTTGNVFARDLGIALPLQGDVVVDDPNKHLADPCSPGKHQAVWILALSVAGQSINLPVYVDATQGPEQGFGSAKLVVCLGPADTPAGSPGRSPNGAQLLDATFQVSGVFQVPATGATVWKALTTPYASGNGMPNAAGSVETRSYVGSGAVTIRTRVLSRGKRLLAVSGTITQAGQAVASATARLLLNGRPRFSARTKAGGAYSILLKNTSRKRTTTTFQVRTTVGDRDVTATGCTGPTFPSVRCVSATAGGFTAVSRKIKIRL